MAKQRVFKSKKKLSGTRAEYRPWKEWETGDIIIGEFVGSKTDNYDKPNWLIKVEDSFLADKKLQKKLKGQIIGLNSAGKLDKAMEDVEKGQLVQIEYKGASMIEKGKYKGKEAHDIEVDLVEEETDDEDDQDEENEEESEESSDDADEETQDDDDEEVDL